MKAETLSFYERAVRHAVSMVIESLDGALDLRALARQAAMSPFHFHRVFRGMVGETPLELHRRLRLERAAWRLREGDDPVTDIAFGAGYETHEAFTRAFRTRYDCSPSEFRRGRGLDADGCARPFQIELTARSGVHFRPEGTGPLHIHFTRGGPNMNVETVDRPELRVATVRHVGPYDRIAEAFARLGQLAAANHLFAPQAEMIAIYHDDPESTPPAELRSDAAISIAADARVPDGLDQARLPGGRYARAIHVGPYRQLGDAWARLMGEWLPQSGFRVGEGVAYEIYRNTPGEVPEDQLVTELYLQLA